MKQLPIIQSLWIGDKLSTMERLCIVSFMKHGHTFHLYIYDKVEGVPDGTIIKNANEILPSNRIFKYKRHNSYAGFANLFRYKLLYDKGNYWVDMDNVCLQPFTDDQEYIFTKERIKNLDENTHSKQLSMRVNNNIIKAPKGSEIMKFCYLEANSRDSSELKWGETGPKLIDYAVNKFALQSYTKEPDVYCHIDAWDWQKTIDGSLSIDDLEEACSLHLYNEMWRRNKVDKDGQFEKESLYQLLKWKYLGDKFDSAHPNFTIENVLLNHEDINIIRDTALALEKLNIQMSYQLMVIAKKLRPEGEFINDKLKSYEKIIKTIK